MRFLQKKPDLVLDVEGIRSKNEIEKQYKYDSIEVSLQEVKDAINHSGFSPAVLSKLAAFVDELID